MPSACGNVSTAAAAVILGPFIRLAVLGSILFVAAGLHAQSMADAKAAFTAGRYLDAAGLAEAVGTSAGYALAAQSLAVYGYYVAPEEDRTGLFERAMRLGEEAVRADPGNADAYFQSAHAMGRYAQGIGTMKALREGLGGKTRAMMDAALAIDPDMVEAHVALAAWHADVVAKAGRLVARAMYGATRREAIDQFERTLELAPHSNVALLEYARRLPALDREAGRERALELLSKAVELPVRDVYDGFIHQRVVAELAAIHRE